jgi:hypothetical protein
MSRFRKNGKNLKKLNAILFFKSASKNIRKEKGLKYCGRNL